MNNSQSLFDVSKDIVIITGVSGQLGYEYANAFLIQGAKVTGIDIGESDNSFKLMNQFPQNFHFAKANVTNKNELKQVLSQVKNLFGTPSILVNNAAIDSPPSAPPLENGPYEDYPESSWDKVMSVNLKGVHLCCQVFGDAMAKVQKGSIINIASIYGVVSPDQSIYDYRRERGEIFYKPVAYSVSKSGILNLTRYLAVYWAKANVRVNTLTIAGVFNNQEQAFLDAYNKRIPIGRMARANEYTGAVIFLASQASSYMTGSNLTLDGGWTAI